MKLLIGLILLSFIISCEKVVYFDVETQEGKLVVNSFVQPDSSVNMRVTLSTDPLAVGFENVEVTDATIKFYQNDNFVGNFDHIIGGDYYFPFTSFDAIPSDHFKIEVTAPGREMVTAETSLPSAVIIEEAKIIDTVFVQVQYSAFDSLGNYYVIDTVVPHYQLQLTFTDPDGPDFYSLKINYEDAYSESYTCFTTDDPVFTAGDYDIGNGNEDEDVTLCDEVNFTDITFSGKKKTMTVSLVALPTEFIIDPKFVIRLNHLSEEYYKYIASSGLQASTGDNPFGEPVVVFSNIENGFGIFAGSSSAFAEVEL